MSEAFAEHFVIWEPRDVVGGNIFWCRRWLGGMLLIVADCTGHGVPGAFMTLIANDALDNAQAELTQADPGAIIRRMHWWIRRKLSRDEEGHSESNDGLELGVCYLHPDHREHLWFSGARQSLFRALNGDIGEIKGPILHLDRKASKSPFLPIESGKNATSIHIMLTNQPEGALHDQQSVVSLRRGTINRRCCKPRICGRARKETKCGISLH